MQRNSRKNCTSLSVLAQSRRATEVFFFGVLCGSAVLREHYNMERLFGDIVSIDLTTRRVTRETCPRSEIRAFLGGRGLATSILLDRLTANVHPLDPQNVLVFATGLLTGTDMIAASRLHVCARSPLTGLIGTSNGGGDVADELRLCGIGALVISGESASPSCMVIQDGKISLEDASDVWGFSTLEARERILEYAEPNTKVITIGQAGENLCAFAAIMVAVGHFAGRTGLGAVMGAKRLKAIRVKASSRPKRPSYPEARRVIREYFETAKETESYRQYSTVGSSTSTYWLDAFGAGAVRNSQDVMFDRTQEATWAGNEEIVEKRKGCYKCPFRCKADVKVDQGRHQGKILERPDFEPIVILGAKCGGCDGREIVYLHNLCNEYGMDSIEAGNLIAFAMELYEKGVLTSNETELDLTWGNIGAMEQLLTQMAYRTSWLGDTLSRGIRDAVQLIGRESARYALDVKGLTITAMDPRGFKATGLGYAVAARGGDYTHVYARPEYSITPDMARETYGTEHAADRLSEDGKAAMVRDSIRLAAIVDSVGLCKIPHISFLFDQKLEIISQLLKHILNIKLSPAELFVIGERIVNAERFLNFRFGATGRDDRLPEKFLQEPIAHGASQGSIVNLRKMLQEYYALMGWDSEGRITHRKLRELGLEKWVSTTRQEERVCAPFDKATEDSKYYVLT